MIISSCFGSSESLGKDLVSPPLGVTTPTDEIQGRQDHSFRFLSRKKEVVDNPWNIKRKTYLWMLQAGNCGNYRSTIAADSRSSDYVMPGSGALSQDPGWLTLTANWSEDENLKTDSSRHRSVYKTPTKTRRQFGVLCQRPHPSKDHESRKRGPPPLVMFPWWRGVWPRK